METAVSISPGMPVEIGRIEKDLGRLWEEIGDSKTRASLINLAIYTEKESDVSANTELISKIASEHACRAILIYANREAEQPGAKAWINAHCHAVNRREICSEQITFQLDGRSPAALSNVVFAHLDSDLPLCFWHQAPFREPLDSKLWRWIDRLIFDSRTWDDPAAQLAIVRRIAGLSGVHSVLCDLNWTRLLSLRQGLAQFFDNSCALPYLEKVDRVEIRHAPGSKVSALLLLGWLAGQLGWQLDSVLGRHSFRAPDRSEVAFELIESDGPCISSCRLLAGKTEFRLDRAEHGKFFHATKTGGHFDDSSQLLPAGRDRIEDTLLVELGRGGTHPLYLQSVGIIEPLLV